MWSERIIKICFLRGVAPVYKPGDVATIQYHQTDAGYLASFLPPAQSAAGLSCVITIQTHPAAGLLSIWSMAETACSSLNR
jgi:hypothetical protein